MGLIPGLETFPGEGLGNPLQYSCLENPHGQKSLASYSPQSRKELDTTEAATQQEIGYEAWQKMVRAGEQLAFGKHEHGSTASLYRLGRQRF